MIALVYLLLFLVALMLIWEHYGHFVWFGDPLDRLGWRASLGDAARLKSPSVSLTWEKYPIRKPKWLEVRVEAKQVFLAYPPALSVRWGAFRLVVLGRLRDS